MDTIQKQGIDFCFLPNKRFHFGQKLTTYSGGFQQLLPLKHNCQRKKKNSEGLPQFVLKKANDQLTCFLTTILLFVEGEPQAPAMRQACPASFLN